LFAQSVLAKSLLMSPILALKEALNAALAALFVFAPDTSV
jgi:hypothetical protein